jgi:hypothetical protein
MSLFGGIFATIFVAVGIFFVIPLAGPFGVIWTLLAAAGAVTGFYNAFSKRGIATEIIDVSDDASLESDDAETRLRRLDDLKTKNLITPSEYERRRSEILNAL